MYGADCAKKNKENMGVRNTESKNHSAGKEIEQDHTWKHQTTITL